MPLLYTEKLTRLQRFWIGAFVLFFLPVLFCHRLQAAYLLPAALLLLLCAGLAFSLRRLRGFCFAAALFALALGLRVLVIFFFRGDVTSDFVLLLDASRSLLRGDLSYLDSGYFQLWPYQNGFVLYQSLLLRLCDKITFLRLINALLSSGTAVLVYLIVREPAGERAGRFGGLLCGLLPFSMSYVTVLSNQFPASFLIYGGLWLMITRRVRLSLPIRSALCGLILALANALRPESIIPLFSLLLCFCLSLRRGTLRQTLLSGLCLAAAYFLSFAIISELFILSGLSPLGLGSEAPYWKFVLGFNHQTMGRYCGSDTVLLLDPPAAYATIRERILVPLPQLLELFFHKLRCFWQGFDSEWWYLGCPLADGRLLRLFSACAGCVELLLEMLTVVGCLLPRRGGERDPRLLLFVTQLFVTLGVYLLIEVQPRYLYHIQTSLCILAAVGADALLTWRPRKKGPVSP